MWPPPGNQWADVKEGETTEVEVALKRGGSITGRVIAHVELGIRKCGAQRNHLVR